MLLADEPTGSLDFRTGEMIMDLLEDLHRSRQLTSIHVTHNLNFARRADRVLTLERGHCRALLPSDLRNKAGTMFERYTEKARRVIFFARYEASQFGSPCIETEHLLLGLLREDKALANRFLRSSASVESIRKQIEAHTTLREKVSTSVDLPLSHECKRVLAYGAEEAERLNHKHIGTEHLLLGLLREEKCFRRGYSA